MAQFANIPPANYTAIAFHESVNPSEASQEVSLAADELLQVTFTYLEPERQLLRVFVQHYPFDSSTNNPMNYAIDPESIRAYRNLVMVYANGDERADKQQQRADEQQQRADRLAEILKSRGINPDEIL